MKKLSVFVILSLILLSCKKHEEQNVLEQSQVPAVKTEEPQDGNFCYLKVISKDSIILNFARKGDSVVGRFDWKPYEKDKKLSMFKGIVNGSSVNALANYQAEGMNYTEELIFSLEATTATVKYGEMVESDNGIWMYKNKAKTSEQKLDQVECK